MHIYICTYLPIYLFIYIYMVVYFFLRQGHTTTQQESGGLLDRALGRHEDQCRLAELRPEAGAPETNTVASITSK